MIPCLICGKKYKAPAMHARQAHDMTAREYKEMHGLDVKRGILIPELRAVKSIHAKSEDNIKMLLDKGAKYRYKKKHKRTYTRSAQTIERLKIHALNMPHNNRQPQKRVEITCGTCGKKKNIPLRQKGVNNYCNRSCSTIANNKQRSK